MSARAEHGSPAWMTPGAKVLTETTSGEKIICTVIEADSIYDGNWVLASPAHGYAIHRHFSECEPFEKEGRP
jgi:hypothetical protein